MVYTKTFQCVRVKYFEQGLTLTVARLPGATDFRWGQVKKYRQWPWAIASICSILNVNDCHKRQHMSVASRASDKLGGQVPQKDPIS